VIPPFCRRNPGSRGRAWAGKGFPLRLVLLAALVLLAGSAGDVAAQEPPDTIPPPTITEPVLPDSVRLPTEEEMAAEALPRLLPAVEETLPSGASTGRWIWDAEALLRTRALTLLELLDQVPGAVPVRGGDYGAPVAVGGFGVGADRIRVFRDGVEVLPLLGGSVDLAREGLAGQQRVTVDRLPGEIRVYLESLRPEDPRPFSFIEVGTGDFETNLFRGTFLHPRVGGGILQVGLDRLDTRGPRGQESGTASSGHVQFSRRFGERFGVSAGFRSASSNRGDLYVPSQVSRSEFGLRGVAGIAPGVVATVYGQRAREEGSGMPEEELPAPARSRDQVGLRVDLARGVLRGGVHGRRASGEGWPGTTLDAHLGVEEARLGGVEAGWTRESGEGEGASRLRLRGWTAPLAGVSLFGSLEDGRAGAPPAPGLATLETIPGEPGETPTTELVIPPLGAPRFSDRSTLRLGGTFAWRGLEAWGAWLRVESDSLVPLGLPFDVGGESLPGGTRTGWEAGGRIPLLLLDGLALEGWTQQWATDNPEGPWPFLPARSYEARLAFRDTFFPTGNLEVHFDVGARGRDGMLVWAEVPEEGVQPVPVPFFQSWSARLQIRVVTVRIFLVWENVTLRPENRDIPGRNLPQTRAVYGLRWTLWN